MRIRGLFWLERQWKWQKCTNILLSLTHKIVYYKYTFWWAGHGKGFWVLSQVTTAKSRCLPIGVRCRIVILLAPELFTLDVHTDGGEERGHFPAQHEGEITSGVASDSKFCLFPNFFFFLLLLWINLLWLFI